MANPTTDYGWPMPTSTDLVTDLPADFALFGQPVDTSLKALNPETTLGDIAYRSATSNTNTRLGIGTAGQVLAVSGGVPAWTTTADVTPLTTKGDVFTFSTVDARIGVGANNTVLTADSAEATGLKWATPSAGALTFIQRTSFSNVASTTTSFDGVFTSTYFQYIVRIESLYASTGTDDLQIQMRYAGPTTQDAGYYGATQSSAYNTSALTYVGSNGTAELSLVPNIGSSTEMGSGQINFSNVGNTSESARMYGNYTTMSSSLACFFGGSSNTARTYTGFLLKSASSNITGTVSVYGMAKA